MSNTNPTSNPAHTNRLVTATSPYLQQHAHNPVDWYEWGPDALQRAKRENKPIFLSIGYSACHWCHVMAHESFENEQIAAIMNRLFINIKVDREERPDLDDIYMQATLAYTQGQGGWPMSVWLTPDLKPFAAGTYFPPTSRWNRPGFGDLCERIGELWSTRRAEIEGDADRLAQYVALQLSAGADAPPASQPTFSLDLLDRAADAIVDIFDADRGGMLSGGTNKFPPSMAMDFLLRTAQRERADAARRDKLRQRVFVTLDHIAAGGIYDHLAGGIARYSTDPSWLVPHFEKMLYDQALVSRIALDVHQVRGDRASADFARGIFDYVLADLTAPTGGFYSSRDADSEGKEGEFYVWRKAEILATLGDLEGALFCDAYDVTEGGNWDDPHEPGAPKNILNLPRSIADFARAQGLTESEAERRLAAARAKLRSVRESRTPPHRDEKILCEWNGLMIASLARGGAVLNEPRYIAAAARAADFILKNQYRDGRLLRSSRDGRTLNTAFLADYANMIDALLELYEATFERRWLDAAVGLNNTVITRYWDEQGGGFFTTADDHEELFVRAKDLRDSATPSGNSVQLMNLLRISAMLDDRRARDLAQRMLFALADDVRGAIGSAERFLCGVELALTGPIEIAIVGDPADPRTQALLQAARGAYVPNRVIMLRNPAQPADAAPQSPLLVQRELVNHAPAAYVCRNYACKRPATSPAELSAQLAE